MYPTSNELEICLCCKGAFWHFSFKTQWRPKRDGKRSPLASRHDAWTKDSNLRLNFAFLLAVPVLLEPFLLGIMKNFNWSFVDSLFFSTSLSEHPEKARGEVRQSTALQLEATLGLPLWAPGGEVSAKNNTQVLLACLLWGGVLQQKVNFFWQKSGGFTDEILSSIFGVGVSEI